jgi:hypothetical protein
MTNLFRKKIANNSLFQKFTRVLNISTKKSTQFVHSKSQKFKQSRPTRTAHLKAIVFEIKLNDFILNRNESSKAIKENASKLVFKFEHDAENQQDIVLVNDGEKLNPGDFVMTLNNDYNSTHYL